MSGETLFDLPAGRVRHTDPVTSVAAARAVDPAIEDDVRRVLAKCGPMTLDEIADRLPKRHRESVKSAVSRAGVDATGAKRPSATGRPSMVWQLK
jgi:predicted ArsR family transcriptional regulator